jgi:hypothetical protein
MQQDRQQITANSEYCSERLDGDAATRNAMSDVSEEAPSTHTMLNATLQDSWKRLWVDLPPGVDVESLAERLGRGMVSNPLTIEVRS